MNCTEVREVLEIHVDGGLEPDRRRAVEEHVASCADCAARLRQLAALLEDARALPRSIEPRRQLWPGIAARLRPRGAAARHDAPPAGTGGPRRLQIAPWLLAAAATAVMIASSAVTALLMRPGVGDGPATLAAGLPAALVALEEDYTAAVAEIERVLQESRSAMAPEAVAAVERSLRVLDEAIQESRAALVRSPANEHLSRLLWATYQQKLDLLKRATRLTGEL
jgi:hypothetical protein